MPSAFAISWFMCSGLDKLRRRRRQAARPCPRRALAASHLRDSRSPSPPQRAATARHRCDRRARRPAVPLPQFRSPRRRDRERSERASRRASRACGCSCPENQTSAWMAGADLTMAINETPLDRGDRRRLVSALVQRENFLNQSQEIAHWRHDCARAACSTYSSGREDPPGQPPRESGSLSQACVVWCVGGGGGAGASLPLRAQRAGALRGGGRGSTPPARPPLSYHLLQRRRDRIVRQVEVRERRVPRDRLERRSAHRARRRGSTRGSGTRAWCSPRSPPKRARAGVGDLVAREVEPLELRSDALARYSSSAEHEVSGDSR